jgi:transcriptional regulator with XRE-family HTH domain
MTTEDVMKGVRAAYRRSPLTLGEIGVRMGHPPAAARQIVWNLLNTTTNPSVDTLVRFAAALGVDPRVFFVVARQEPGVRTAAPKPFTFIG